MRVDDYYINRQVRALLVQMGVDTSKFKIDTYSGKVFLRGSFKKMSESADTDAASSQKGMQTATSRLTEDEILMILELEIHRIEGVSTIVWGLDNVLKQRGHWKLKQK